MSKEYPPENTSEIVEIGEAFEGEKVSPEQQESRTIKEHEKDFYEKSDELKRGKDKILSDELAEEIKENLKKQEKEETLGTKEEITEGRIINKEIAAEEPITEKKPWYKRIFQSKGFKRFGLTSKIVTAPTIAAAMMTSGTEAKNFEDTTAKKPIAEKVVTINPSDSLDKNLAKPLTQITADREKKTIGKVTIEGRYMIPYHDKSVEVCVVYVSGNEKDKNKTGEILNAMEKDGGWEAASGEMLDDIADENKDFSSKMPWVMSLNPENDQDDSRSQEGGYKVVEEKGVKKTKKVIPEHAVFPTRTPAGSNRFEASQGVTYSEDSYGYVFYRKATTAHYESGLAKAK